MESARTWSPPDWAKTVFLGCVLFLLFFSSARALHVSELNWHSDDGCYLQHLGDYLGIEGSHICRAGEENYYARGVALIWLIPAWIGKIVAHLRGENVTEWVLPIVAGVSYACWILAAYFVARI